MKKLVTYQYQNGMIKTRAVYAGLMHKLEAAAHSKRTKTTINILNAFINQVRAQRGKAITTDAANLLIADTEWLIASLKK